MIHLPSKRIVVTGGAGFLGSHLLRRLERMGCRDVFVPIFSEYDLTRIDAIERLFDEHRPEILIHMAAVVGGIGANRATLAASSTTMRSWASSSSRPRAVAE